MASFDFKLRFFHVSVHKDFSKFLYFIPRIEFSSFSSSS